MLDVRFIEYMPFDGNKWNTRKFLPYEEMLKIIKKRWPNLQRHNDTTNDTAKVSEQNLIYSKEILNTAIIIITYNIIIITEEPCYSKLFNCSHLSIVANSSGTHRLIDSSFILKPTLKFSHLANPVSP